MQSPLAVIAMPRASAWVHAGAAEAFYRRNARDQVEVVAWLSPQSSLITGSFNACWVDAINLRRDFPGLRYFAMQHADIEPVGYWLDDMIEELERVGADLLSAVSPIKDGRGLTSTAIDGMDGDTGTNGSHQLPRRLTMREIQQLPETFSSDDAGGRLLVNTGLWVCRFDKLADLPLHFEQRSWIDRLPSGQASSGCESEDWLFSKRCHELGLKLFATRKVPLKHHGEHPFGNQTAWGTWATDHACR